MKLLANLRAGVRLVFCQRVEASDFRPSQDQLLAVIALSLGVGLLCDRLATAAPVWFDASAIAPHAAWLLLSLLFVYAGVREAERPSRFLLVGVAFFSALFLGWFGYLAVMLADYHELVPDWLVSEQMVLTFLVSWLGYVALRSLSLSGLRAIRAVPLAMLYVMVLALGASHYGLPEFWRYDGPALAESGVHLEDAEAINAEDLFYAQNARMQAATASLMAQRPGVVDLYFIGFAADAEQDVFMREVNFARELFDDRFETAGRSVILVNNEDTVDSAPIASENALRSVIADFGETMDVEEDVLFLFLTGHGSKSHRLAVSFPPLSLNRFGGESIAAMLEAAGIRWSVVVVSACYSGGFIEPLASDTTLVMTSARSDRKSFGCSNEAEGTYFGRAFFREALPQARSLVEAFEAAKVHVTEWETEEDYTPSLPQIASAEPILRKLKKIEDRLPAPDSLVARAAAPVQ